MLKQIMFDWDQWNAQKNEVKHGVSTLEAESVFYDRKYKLYEDIKHSSKAEKRYILYGKSMENRILMTGFTIRKGKIRIITSRTASKKEKNIYEN